MVDCHKIRALLFSWDFWRKSTLSQNPTRWIEQRHVEWSYSLRPHNHFQVSKFVAFQVTFCWLLTSFTKIPLYSKIPFLRRYNIVNYVSGVSIKASKNSHSTMKSASTICFLNVFVVFSILSLNLLQAVEQVNHVQITVCEIIPHSLVSSTPKLQYTLPALILSSQNTCLSKPYQTFWKGSWRKET